MTIDWCINRGYDRQIGLEVERAKVNSGDVWWVWRNQRNILKDYSLKWFPDSWQLSDLVIKRIRMIWLVELGFNWGKQIIVNDMTKWCIYRMVESFQFPSDRMGNVFPKCCQILIKHVYSSPIATCVLFIHVCSNNFMKVRIFCNIITIWIWSLSLVIVLLEAETSTYPLY